MKNILFSLLLLVVAQPLRHQRDSQAALVGHYDLRGRIT
jgi:hypothetical protein